MKIIIAGGTGHVGAALLRDLGEKGHEVVILSRGSSGKTIGVGMNAARIVHWDGVNKGDWFSEFHDTDVVINLAGRTVNCRYTKENLRQMMDS